MAVESERADELEYAPTKCNKTYRMIVLRKNLAGVKGEKGLFDEIRYFYYITNDRVSSAATIIRLANQRCNLVNPIEQLNNGGKALRMPVDNLVSDWAYMVMAALAWTMKAWFAVLSKSASLSFSPCFRLAWVFPLQFGRKFAWRSRNGREGGKLPAAEKR